MEIEGGGSAICRALIGIHHITPTFSLLNIQKPDLWRPGKARKLSAKRRKVWFVLFQGKGFNMHHMHMKRLEGVVYRMRKDKLWEKGTRGMNKWAEQDWRAGWRGNWANSWRTWQSWLTIMIFNWYCPHATCSMFINILWIDIWLWTWTMTSLTTNSHRIVINKYKNQTLKQII